jgi:hypothetical protein
MAVFLAILLLAGDWTNVPAVPPDQPSEGAPRQAADLFRQGLDAFDARDYPLAIERFRAAHRLSPMPEILFDIALAYKVLGDCQRASEAFEAFFAAVPARDPLVPRARAKHRELGPCANDKSPRAAQVGASAGSAAPPRGLEQPTSAVGAPSLLIQARPSVHAEPFYRRPGCIAAGTTTLLLGVTGSVFGLAAWSAARDLEGRQTWDADAVRTEERGRAYGQSATALLVASGAASLLAAGICALRW